MKTLSLTGRSTEIAEQIPRQYRKVILNSILAKSLSNGSLADELLLYLPENEVEEIMDSLKISKSYKVIPKQKKMLKPSNYEKKSFHKEKVSKSESKFAGFDD